MKNLKDRRISPFVFAGVGDSTICDEDLKENALLLCWCILLFVKKVEGIPSIDDVLSSKLGVKSAYKKIAETLNISSEYSKLGEYFKEALLPNFENDSKIKSILKMYNMLHSDDTAYSTISEQLLKKVQNKMWAIPSSLAGLMWNLGNVKNGDVYTTSHSLLSRANIQESKGRSIIIETEKNAFYMTVFSLIYGFKYVEANAIVSPQVFNEKGGLKQFEVVHLAIPNYTRLEEAPVDLCNRFQSKTTNGVVLEVENGLAHCSGRLIAIVPQGFLFNMAQNYELRVLLVDSGILDVVIQIPSNIRGAFNTSLVMVVIDKGRKKEKPVLFYDAVYDVESSEESSEYKESHQEREMDVSKIADDILNNTEGDFSAFVTRDEIIDNGYDLSVRRYSHNTATKKMLSLRNTKKLCDISELIRAQQLKSENKEGDVFHIINNKDVSESGLINEPMQHLVLSTQMRTRAKKQLLKENDIVISTKGNVGTVGLVDERCGDNWVANQIFTIIRLKQGCGIESSQYLFRYLKSPLVQAYLQGMIVGNAVESLKSSDVKELLVPIPTGDEEARVLTTNREIINGYYEIEDIRNECEEQNSEHWPVV